MAYIVIEHSCSNSESDPMRVEPIGESIDVIALFRAGQITPVKLRWRERVHKVSKVNGWWTSEEGAVRICHFAVTFESSDVYELTYRERTHAWRIERVSLDT